jgi:hypothetical protein
VRSDPAARESDARAEKLSDQLEGWLAEDGDKTLGGLANVFREKTFAVLFVLLLCVPALPLPTGGATHVFEVIAVLLAVQLIAGRSQIWLPRRWRALELAGAKRERFVRALMQLIRRLERVSRPRLPFLLKYRLSKMIFGALVAVGSTAAFLAPPFSGLDTLPALGVVVLSLGVLLEDVLVVIAGMLVGAVGIAIEVALGRAVIHGIGNLL